MTEQWKELKETIIELRDNDGMGTQQEVCKFLANLMDVLEKQMDVLEKQMNDKCIPESCEDTISRKAVFDFIRESELGGWVELPTETCVEFVTELPAVTPKQKTGKWIHRTTMAGRIIETHICSECREEFSYDAETGVKIDNYKFCPNCGTRMKEKNEEA